MANNATLKATVRQERGKGAARRMRAAGRVPAVVYGRGEDSIALSVDAHEMSRLFAGIPVESTVITLDIEGTKSVPVLVREVQSHPYRADFVHVDFYQVHAGEELTVSVPVRVEGTPEGVKAGGILDQMLHELEVRCIPSKIPEAIEVDVSALEIGGAIHVGDLTLPEGVVTDIEDERTICSVGAPTVAAVEPGAEQEEGVGGEVEPELVREPGNETSA